MPESLMPVELKSGTLLKFKKRLLRSNWRKSLVSLFSDATLVSRRRGNQISPDSVIQMANQTTLIIFGHQLKDVPKKPILPSGYRMEQLLAIGLIQSMPRNGTDKGSAERLTIMFHWFLPLSIQDLFDWIIAINGSIPNNKQILTNDELTMSLVLAEAVHYNHMQMLMPANDSANASGYHYDGRNDIDGSNRAARSSSMHDNNSVDVGSYEDYYNDTGMDAAFECGAEFDDCSAFAAADSFAIF